MTKFDNIQRTLLEHPAKKLDFRGGKLFFLSSGGAAAFLHKLHVAPLDAGDPIHIYVQRGMIPAAAEIEAVLSFRVDNNENGRVRAAAATGCETQKTKRCPILFG